MFLTNSALLCPLCGTIRSYNYPIIMFFGGWDHWKVYQSITLIIFLSLYLIRAELFQTHIYIVISPCQGDFTTLTGRMCAHIFLGRYLSLPPPLNFFPHFISKPKEELYSYYI